MELEKGKTFMKNWSQIWYSLGTLAGMELATLPRTAIGLRKKAEREKWEARGRNARGGGKEYKFASLPHEAQVEIAFRECWEQASEGKRDLLLDKEDLELIGFENLPDDPTSRISLFSEEDQEKIKNAIFGNSKSSETLREKLLKQFNIEITQEVNLEDFAYIPLYKAFASAGHGAENPDYVAVSDVLAFRKNYLRQRGFKEKDLCIIYASGESMLPIIPDRAAMLVRLDKTAVIDGKIFVIQIDGDLFVKRIERNPTTRGLTLFSENPLHKVRELSPEQLENGNFNIIGQVVQVSIDFY